MNIAKQIQSACQATPPFTTARNKALADVRWVLRDQFGDYVADTNSPFIDMTIERERALVFDGRDNEEFKVRYYNAVTGLEFEAVLV